MEKRFVIRDIEKALNITRRTYYRWEAAGKVPNAKRNPMSNQRYWMVQDVERLKKITGRK